MFGATAHKIEPIKNIKAVTKITFFLPKISANLPFKTAPNAAPIKTVETKSPCINSLSSHSLLIYKRAPEITPVSKPESKPPSATKNATKYNIFIFNFLKNTNSTPYSYFKALFKKTQ